jgi:hypothetical protein
VSSVRTSRVFFGRTMEGFWGKLALTTVGKHRCMKASQAAWSLTALLLLLASTFCHGDVGGVPALVVSGGSSPSPGGCNGLTGFRRLVQLFAGHWDAVSVIAFPEPAVDVNGNATMYVTYAGAVVQAALCGRPLVLNSFGAKAQNCSNGWTAPGAAGCVSLPAAQPGPAWKRDPHAPSSLTRVFSTDTVPDPRTAGAYWQANQHDSPVLRPADVAVYVASTRTARAALQHLAFQANETLHAVMVLGPVCPQGDVPSAMRCVCELGFYCEHTHTVQSSLQSRFANTLGMLVVVVVCVCVRARACVRACVYVCMRVSV